jgi:hypothetical protein
MVRAASATRRSLERLPASWHLAFARGPPFAPRSEAMPFVVISALASLPKRVNGISRLAPTGHGPLRNERGTDTEELIEFACGRGERG